MTRKSNSHDSRIIHVNGRAIVRLPSYISM